MKKVVRVLLALALIVSVFPCPPARGEEGVTAFQVEISVDSIPGIIIHNYDSYGTGPFSTYEDLLLPEGYTGNIHVTISAVTADIVNAMVGGMGLTDAGEDSIWTGEVGYQAGHAYAGEVSLQSEQGQGDEQDISFMIPALAYIGVNIDGDGAEVSYSEDTEAYQVFYTVTAKAVDIPIVITVPESVISPEAPLPVMGGFTMGEDWKHWTLTFLDDEPAILAQQLRIGELPLELRIEISLDLTMVSGVTVNGPNGPPVIDYSMPSYYAFEASVTEAAGIQIEIEAAEGVTCLSAAAENGFTMIEDDWMRWNLDFDEGQWEASLDLELQYRGSGTTKWLYIYISRPPDWIRGVTVTGSDPLQPEFSDDIYFYETFVTGAGPFYVEIEAAEGVLLAEPEQWGGFTTADEGLRNWALNFEEETTYAWLRLRLMVAGSQTSIRLHIGISRAPEWVTGLSVNGTPYSCDVEMKEEEIYYYHASLAVNQLTGNQIVISGGEGVFPGAHISHPENAFIMINDSWLTWTLNMNEEGTAVLTIPLEQDAGDGYSWQVAELQITVNCQNPPDEGDDGGEGGDDSNEGNEDGGGDGGGGGDEGDVEGEKPNVTNRTNEPNASSDTILIPVNTMESDGRSVTSVTSEEIAALVNLAEAHSGDVEEGDNEAIIQIEDRNPEGNNAYEINLNAGDVGIIAGSSIDLLAVNTGISQFRIRSEALRGLDTGSGGNVQIKLLKVDHDGKPGIDATLAVGEKIITVVDGVYSLEIRIPYKPQPGEDTAALCIEYIREDGTTELVRESRYDPDKEMVSFFPAHLSKYGVAYRPILFSDVAATHWANGYITFLAARDVITNPPGTKFRPDDAITRAEFINMAARAFAVANLGKRALQSYLDVAPDQWYALAVGWSYMNNISPVLASGGNFYPEQSLDREEMSTLANNVSLSLGLRLRTENPVVRFSDAQTISSYARDAVSRMVACGIVPEGGGGRFLPKSSYTRAEAARSISLLMSRMR